MGGTIQTCRIAKMTPYRRSAAWRKVTNEIKSAMLLSPPASPFNSTTFLMRQRKEAGMLPLSREDFVSMLDQYGSNIVNHCGSDSENMMASCCTFATANHDQGCDCNSEANHPVIIGPCNSKCELRAKASIHGARSAGTRKQVEDLVSAAHENGRAILEHRRTQSFTESTSTLCSPV